MFAEFLFWARCRNGNRELLDHLSLGLAAIDQCHKLTGKLHKYKLCSVYRGTHLNK